MTLPDETEGSPQRRNKGHEYYLEAQCLFHGHGIEPNKEYAITWFERSANQGEGRAFSALGRLYEEG
jgi:TPR repeat protein